MQSRFWILIFKLMYTILMTIFKCKCKGNFILNFLPSRTQPSRNLKENEKPHPWQMKWHFIWQFIVSFSCFCGTRVANQMQWHYFHLHYPFCLVKQKPCQNSNWKCNPRKNDNANGSNSIAVDLCDPQ